MNYQVWEAYYPGSGFASVEEIAGLTDEQERAIFLGTPLPLPLPRITLKRLTRGKMPDALGTVTASRLVSARLREVIEACCPQGIQFIPAVASKSAKMHHFMANITLHYAGFDRERSQYRAFADPPHAICAIKKMVLRPIPEDAPAIFHLQEIPAVILVRDDLRRAMQSVSSSAGSFTVADRYRFGVW
jgi:hypothetical protein